MFCTHFALSVFGSPRSLFKSDGWIFTISLFLKSIFAQFFDFVYSLGFIDAVFIPLSPLVNEGNMWVQNDAVKSPYQQQPCGLFGIIGCVSMYLAFASPVALGNGNSYAHYREVVLAWVLMHFDASGFAEIPLSQWFSCNAKGLRIEFRRPFDLLSELRFGVMFQKVCPIQPYFCRWDSVNPSFKLNLPNF